MNYFERLADLGYTRLVPVIPPTAEISQGSSLFKRLGTKQDGRGKTPGVKGRDGKFYSFDWVPYEADERDYRRWHDMGAGVGIKTGRGLVGIDADTLDDGHAKIIKDTIEEELGISPIRVGNRPKALYPFRVTGPVQYQRIDFGPNIAPPGEAPNFERVEILSDGRFFVAQGIHPKTGKPYEWLRPPTAVEALPVVTPEQITQLLEMLRMRLPEASKVQKEGGTSEVSQQSLRSAPEIVRKAVTAIPNTSALFPSRESYRDMGYAIKAAVENEHDAFEIFADWCDRWVDGSNDPDVIASDWSRMKPPFRRGAQWLYQLAERHGAGSFSIGEVWFEDLENPDNPFQSLEIVRTPAPSPPAVIEWISPSQWEGRAPAVRQWEVKDWIPRGEVTLLYGDGGIGKTLLAHQYATAAAAGLPWLGQETRKAKVMCFFCEDSADELHRRQIDINRALGLTLTDIDANLRIAPRKYFDNLMVQWDRNTGAMNRQAVWEKLRDDAVAFGADVVIIDTIADAYSGSEIDRAQVSAFIKSCLGRLAQEIGGTVIALGHPSAAGKASGSGTSGSTAWSNAVRSRLYLRYPKGVTKGSVRELEGMKSNYGPAGNLIKLRWDQGAFAVLASSAPQTAEAVERGGVFAVPSVEVAACDALLAALRACSDQRMAGAQNSQFYFLKILRRRESGLIEAFDDAELVRAMNTLEKAGAVVSRVIGRDGSRRPMSGYAVVADILSYADEANGGIFE
ncbi:AAA family ATPase [Rhizobium sp. PP-F2F-G48]|uniref:AAA family ATPase n=1 Tax=Rhizobium sp. PP-F2F-G48 TaxID=2135651 RepID=UPI001044833A|nr:AAA family ATPase [Rhizobium sp. PP-F2F-G48]